MLISKNYIYNIIIKKRSILCIPLFGGASEAEPETVEVGAPSVLYSRFMIGVPRTAVEWAASKQSVEEMIEKTKVRLGKIDIIVNNAGINVPRLLMDSKETNGKFELDEGIWDKVMNVNLHR